jgi:hypothetical protein
MAVRSLAHTRTFEEYENMLEFIESVEGLSYGFNLSKLLGAITINTKIGQGGYKKEKNNRGETDGDNKDERGGDGGHGSANLETHGSAPGLFAKPEKELKIATRGEADTNGNGNAAGVACSAGSSFFENGSLSSNKKNYFCSELVAACLKSMSLIYARRNETYFWPGEFGRGGAIDKSMVDGAYYGEELIIDCKVMEIGNARVQEDRGGGEGIY